MDKDGNPVMHKTAHKALDPAEVQVHNRCVCCPCLWKVSKGGFDGKYLGHEIVTNNCLVIGVSTEGLKGADLADANSKAKLAEALVWRSPDDVNDTRTLVVPANMVRPLSNEQPPVVKQPKATPSPPPKLLSVPEPSASDDQGPHRLLVTWPAAVIENGAIQRYQLRHGPEGENLTTVDVGRNTSYILSDLEPSTDYIIYLDTFIKKVNAPATLSVRKQTPRKARPPLQPGKFRKMEDHHTEDFQIASDPVGIVPVFREQNGTPLPNDPPTPATVLVICTPHRSKCSPKKLTLSPFTRVLHLPSQAGFRKKQSWKKAATVDGLVVAGAYAPLRVHTDGSIANKFESEKHGKTVAEHFVRSEAFVPTIEPERLNLDPFPSCTREFQVSSMRGTSFQTVY